MFGLGLKRKIREMHDSLFEILIDKEFSSDLEMVQRLEAIPYYDRNSDQEFLWNFLKGTYTPHSRCPSVLYDSVSTPLRRRYNIIHRRICEILHPLC